MQLKSSFKIEVLSLSIEDKPVELKGISLEFDIECEKNEYMELCKAVYKMATDGMAETVKKFADAPPPVIPDFFPA